MNILPKVYRFVFICKDRTPNTCHVVARNKDNAIKRLRQLSNQHGVSIEQYVYMEESWLANLMILLLPRYTYRGGKWSEWIRYE